MNEKEAVSKKFMELIQTFKISVLKPMDKRFRNLVPNAGSHILFYITTNGPCTMGDITRIMCCSKQQATQMIDKLIKAGYAQRQSDKEDRRKVWISITKSGEELIKDIMGTIESIFVDSLNVLDEEEIQSFSKAIEIFEYSFNKIHTFNKTN